MNTEQVQTLAERLDTGWRKCERETDPEEKRHLEDHWIRVLREYEAACDETGANGTESEAA